MESAQHPSSKTEEIVAQLLARASEHGHQPVDAMAGQQCCLLGVAGSAAQQKCAQPAAEVEEQRQKRQFQQWLHLHANSLYPTREQKERLATQMGTSYGKVNKLFANHRRRQHKQKTASLDKENRRFPAEESNVGRPGAEHIWAAGKSFDGGLPDSSEAGVSAQLTPPPPSQPMPVQQQQFPGPASAADWLQMLMVARQQQQQQLATGQFFGAPPAVIQQQQQQKGPPPFFNAAPPPPMFSMAEQHRSLQQQSAPAAPNQLLLAALAQAQQQQMAQQQMALMEAAIKKEIVELLDAARSQQNMALLAQHSQLLSQLGQLQREQTQNLITGFHLPPPQPPAHGFFMPSPLIMSPANSAANGSCISPSSSTGSSSDQLPEEEIDPSQLMDLDLIEKQIAAQYNRLSADEAEAVAVLAGLGAIGR